MAMTDRDEQDLILHISGLADGETARRAEALLAESTEARAYADEIQNLKHAIGPSPADEAPLTEAEMVPWLRAAQDAVLRNAPPAITSPTHHSHRRTRILIPFAAAALIVLTVGIWSVRNRVGSGPIATAPIGFIERLPGGGNLGVVKVSESDLLGDETIRLVDQLARIRMDGWTGWLMLNSECALSERGTRIRLIRGRLLVEMNDPAVPLQITARSTTATVQPGLLEVAIRPSGHTWTCYEGIGTIVFKDRTVSLEAGRSLGIVLETGEVYERPSYRPRPRWNTYLNESLDAHRRHAEGSEPHP